MKPLTRKLLAIVRGTHVYMTMFSLVVFSFFALTGLMLNHKAWFGLDDKGAPARVIEAQGHVPIWMLEEPDRLAVVEKLRQTFHISVALSTFESDGGMLYASFQGPGIRVNSVVDCATGEAETTKMYGSLPALLADLHKGTGAAAWVVDSVAVLLLLATASGLVLWIALPKRRLWGILLLVAGVATYLTAYLLIRPL